MTPTANLELAESHINSAITALDNAVHALNCAALAEADVADEAKQIGVYLRHQAASVHALRSALTPDLTALLEESLGASAGEPTA